MSGVMIKMAVYGLVRVLVEWLGELPTWYGVVVLAVGGASAVIGVVYAIFQHELKRLLAFHSIENVGIIVLGLGACLLLHARGADDVGGSRARGRAAAHAQPRRLQGSPVPRRRRVREGRGLARDRPPRRPPAADALDGRRVPRRRDGDRRAPAAERVRLGVAHAPVAARRPGERRRGRGSRGRARARSARRDRRPGRALLREGGRARAARPAAARPNRGGGRRAVPDAGRGRVALAARLHRARSRPRACSPGRSPASRRGRPTTRRARPSRCRGTTRCRRPGSSLVLLVGTALLVAARGRRRAAPAPSWACGQLVGPELAVDERRVHEAAATRARGRAASRRETSRSRCAAASSRRCATRVTSRISSTRTSTARSRGWGSGPPPARGACRAGA